MQLKKILSILPSIQKIKIRSEADYYGASYLVAKKLNLPFPPISYTGWRHGWLLQPLKYEVQVTKTSDSEFCTKFLVPLKEHELFLRNIGIDAKAVGMPFVYAEDIVTEKIERVKNSLLVMPPHTLPHLENKENDEHAYVKLINDLKNKFDLIVVCLHQSCIEKRLWVDAFEKYDIPWIIGADARDRNSLIRMYKIFNSFEFMTTNMIGSHVAYAAYCGCKVSIYGKYIESSKKEFINDPIYKKYPFYMEYNLKHSSEKYIRDSFEFLFSLPFDAKIRIQWAEEQLGKENKVTFSKLAKLLGWELHDQITLYPRYFYFKIKKRIKHIIIRIKSILQEVIKSEGS